MRLLLSVHSLLLLSPFFETIRSLSKQHPVACGIISFLVVGVASGIGGAFDETRKARQELRRLKGVTDRLGGGRR